jgi:hypothetical protein
MRRKLFYGVYLASESISTILDLVRFFAEPDGIRFSHITLRGPYSVNLPRTFLEKINSDPKYEWLVELKEPEGFFLDRQSTVVISVDLLMLTDAFYKKDYRDGIPHITRMTALTERSRLSCSTC